MGFALVVLGAGGTGTYFLKEFSRFIHGTKMEDSFDKMIIFDGDSVEEKNLSRQCFIKEDVGRNKAVVMAEALNDAYGLCYKACPSYLTEVSQLTNVIGQKTPVIISCVDNHACRLLLEEFFNASKNCVYFDAANEFDTGEVVYSFKKNGTISGPLRSYYFPDIKENKGKARVEMSCEELNNVSPQHIFTNMFAGNLLCSGMANLLNGKRIPGFVYFNALNYECHFMAYEELSK